MTSVSLTDLKARLSAYIDRVRAGEDVVVTDRGRAIARIAPITLPDADNPRVQEMLRTGRLRPPTGATPDAFWDEPGPRDNAGRSLAALLEERADRL